MSNITQMRVLPSLSLQPKTMGFHTMYVFCLKWLVHFRNLFLSLRFVILAWCSPGSTKILMVWWRLLRGWYERSFVFWQVVLWSESHGIPGVCHRRSVGIYELFPNRLTNAAWYVNQRCAAISDALEARELPLKATVFRRQTVGEIAMFAFLILVPTTCFICLKWLLKLHTTAARSGRVLDRADQNSTNRGCDLEHVKASSTSTQSTQTTLDCEAIRATQVASTQTGLANDSYGWYQTNGTQTERGNPPIGQMQSVGSQTYPVRGSTGSFEEAKHESEEINRLQAMIAILSDEKAAMQNDLKVMKEKDRKDIKNAGDGGQYENTPKEQEQQHAIASHARQTSFLTTQGSSPVLENKTNIETPLQLTTDEQKLRIDELVIQLLTTKSEEETLQQIVHKQKLKIKDLVNQEATTKTKEETLQRTTDGQKLRIEDLVSQVAIIKSQEETLRRTTNKQKKTAEDLVSQMATIRLEEEMLQQTIEEQEKTIDELANQSIMLESKNDILQHTVETQEKTIEELMTQSAIPKTEEDILQQTVDEQKKTIEDLTSELFTQELVTQAATEESTKHEQELAKLENRVSELANANAKLRETKSTLATRNEQELAAQETRLFELVNANAELRALKVALTKDDGNQGFPQDSQTVKDEYAFMKRELEIANKTAHTLETRVRDLEQTIESIKLELETSHEAVLEEKKLYRQAQTTWEASSGQMAAELDAARISTMSCVDQKEQFLAREQEVASLREEIEDCQSSSDLEIERLRRELADQQEQLVVSQDALNKRDSTINSGDTAYGQLLKERDSFKQELEQKIQECAEQVAEVAKARAWIEEQRMNKDEQSRAWVEEQLINKDKEARACLDKYEMKKNEEVRVLVEEQRISTEASARAWLEEQTVKKDKEARASIEEYKTKKDGEARVWVEEQRITKDAEARAWVKEQTRTKGEEAAHRLKAEIRRTIEEANAWWNPRYDKVRVERDQMLVERDQVLVERDQVRIEYNEARQDSKKIRKRYWDSVKSFEGVQTVLHNHGLSLETDFISVLPKTAVQHNLGVGMNASGLARELSALSFSLAEVNQSLSEDARKYREEGQRDRDQKGPERQDEELSLAEGGGLKRKRATGSIRKPPRPCLDDDWVPTEIPANLL